MIGNIPTENMVCITCGVLSVVCKELMNIRRRDGQTFYCFNGHPMSYSESCEHNKIRRERDLLKQQAARAEDDIRLLQNRLSEEQGKAKKALAEDRKAQRRASAGVCPCCNRTFSQMQRHLKSKHPDFVNSKITSLTEVRHERQAV